MHDLIAIGDIKLDTFVILPEASVHCGLKEKDCKLCVSYGKKIAMEVIATQIAGSAPNVATGLSRLGYKTAVLSAMGEDNTHLVALETLKHEGVGTKFVQAIKGKQSSFSVVLTYKGEKTILTSHTGDGLRLPNPIPSTWAYLGELGANYQSSFRALVAATKKQHLHVAANFGSVQINERSPVLMQLTRRLDVIFLNVEEAQQLTEHAKRDIKTLLKAVHSLGPKLVIMTDGPAGAYGYDGEDAVFCPTFPGKKIESTGAGDAFASGTMGGIICDMPWAEAMLYGAVNAASVVGFVGPTMGLLEYEQIKKRLKSQPGFKIRPL